MHKLKTKLSSIMTNLTNEQIKEIAEQLDCGFRCFWNKETGELIITPDTSKHPEMDTEAWSDELEKLENNFCDYYEIDNLSSSYFLKSWKTLFTKLVTQMV